jgi:hypothetical protein
MLKLFFVKLRKPRGGQYRSKNKALQNVMVGKKQMQWHCGTEQTGLAGMEVLRCFAGLGNDFLLKYWCFRITKLFPE